MNRESTRILKQWEASKKTTGPAITNIQTVPIHKEMEKRFKRKPDLVKELAHKIKRDHWSHADPIKLAQITELNDNVYLLDGHTRRAACFEIDLKEVSFVIIIFKTLREALHAMDEIQVIRRNLTDEDAIEIAKSRYEDAKEHDLKISSVIVGKWIGVKKTQGNKILNILRHYESDFYIQKIIDSELTIRQADLAIKERLDKNAGKVIKAEVAAQKPVIKSTPSKMKATLEVDKLSEVLEGFHLENKEQIIAAILKEAAEQ